jgi:3-(3-hydroxy-phenyl)propionate hydroxylase
MSTHPGLEKFSVVIVGAGPTGVTAATLLAQYGIQCLVLDRWAEVYPQPRAVHLDDEVYRILARLGVADEFALISRRGLGLRLLDPAHRMLAEFQRAGTSATQGFPRSNMYDQPELEAVLRRNLAKHSTVTMRGNVEVQAISGRVLGHTQVDYIDLDTGQPTAVLAGYVLGCDGANSTVRTMLGTEVRDLRFRQRWLVIDGATTAALGHWEGVHQVCDPNRAATYMRVGEHRHRWEFRLRDGESVADYDTVGALRQLLKPWTSRVEDLQLVRVAEYTFRAQIAETWRDGNVFLLGDAAHLTPPFIGQGLGAGLRDAANLAWKLAGVIHGCLPDSALDSYETERKPHALQLIRLAKLMGTMMTEGGTIGNILRRALAPRLAHIPGIRSKVLDSQTPPLRRSCFVNRTREGRHVAGHLTPNATMPNADCRFDAHAAGRFVVVTDTPLSAEQLRHITERGAVEFVALPGNELARWLSKNRAKAALVRPDGTVMAAGRTLAAICTATPAFNIPRVV